MPTKVNYTVSLAEAIGTKIIISKRVEQVHKDSGVEYGSQVYRLEEKTGQVQPGLEHKLFTPANNFNIPFLLNCYYLTSLFPEKFCILHAYRVFWCKDHLVSPCGQVTMTIFGKGLVIAPTYK